jgi:hypothetical protein
MEDSKNDNTETAEYIFFIVHLRQWTDHKFLSY